MRHGCAVMNNADNHRAGWLSSRKDYQEVIGQTDQTSGYESIGGYMAAGDFADGLRCTVAATGVADRADLQKAFESMGD